MKFLKFFRKLKRKREVNNVSIIIDFCDRNLIKLIFHYVGCNNWYLISQVCREWNVIIQEIIQTSIRNENFRKFMFTRGIIHHHNVAPNDNDMIFLSQQIIPDCLLQTMTKRWLKSNPGSFDRTTTRMTNGTFIPTTTDIETCLVSNLLAKLIIECTIPDNALTIIDTILNDSNFVASNSAEFLQRAIKVHYSLSKTKLVSKFLYYHALSDIPEMKSKIYKPETKSKFTLQIVLDIVCLIIYTKNLHINNIVSMMKFLIPPIRDIAILIFVLFLKEIDRERKVDTANEFVNDLQKEIDAMKHQSFRDLIKK